jgi:hypothetical protein
VADAALYWHLSEDLADRLSQRLRTLDHEQDSLLAVEAALDEIGEQRGRDGRVLGRAFPEPERDLDAVSGDAERDVGAALQLDPVESIITANLTSSKRRPISSPSAARVRSTNVRETADFDVERAPSSSSAPTGSCVRW